MLLAEAIFIAVPMRFECITLAEFAYLPAPVSIFLPEMRLFWVAALAIV